MPPSDFGVLIASQCPSDHTAVYAVQAKVIKKHDITVVWIVKVSTPLATTSEFSRLKIIYSSVYRTPTYTEIGSESFLEFGDIFGF